MITIKKQLLTVGLCSSFVYVSPAHSETQYHRLIWDGNPANEAVIGFSPSVTSENPYVTFGYTTNESHWQTQFVDQTYVFDGSLTNHFVRLSGLTENSNIYYRACDQDGCGDRYWFKTAPTDNSPYVFIAGGDTRTGWTNRRMGNDLVAKIRPLFIMHGGDFTNDNTASEMSNWLTDWERTFSNDVIDGISYKRIYPLVPAHGNHEDDNYSTLCEVFGVDANLDGRCDAHDTYNAFTVSPLLRVYTLNSQFQESGWSSHAASMNTWLANDLSFEQSNSKWRIAQYHKPMFPHYSGKAENRTLFDWWAQDFYEFSMNLVVESDTHMNKLTHALAPSGSNFITSNIGGTVYVGEGSWGAPARSANDPKSWTIDLASIQQFKVITVQEEGLNIRTAQFDTTAQTLSKEQRETNSISLPEGINWWSANVIGEVMELTQNSEGLSVVQAIQSNTRISETVSLAVSDDVFLSKSNGNTNYNNSSEGLLADDKDGTYGKMQSLIKFDLVGMPTCAVITETYLEFNITNASIGKYNIFLGEADWSEDTATWNSVGGNDQRGTLITQISPSATGVMIINLSDAAIVEHWLQNENYGLVIASNGTNDGLDMTSKESGTSPILKIVYERCEG